MPKSFSLNALSRPILASLVAVSAFAPTATRAAEPEFLQVKDFDSVMALSPEAREQYIGLVRETLVYMADSDAGTDHEFFGANDANAPIVSNGWRGGYYAIVNAFMAPAHAVKFWPFGGDDDTPLTYEKYLLERARIANEAPVRGIGRGSTGSTSGWEIQRGKRLKDLDNRWEADAKSAANYTEAQRNNKARLEAQSNKIVGVIHELKQMTPQTSQEIAETNAEILKNQQRYDAIEKQLAALKNLPPAKPPAKPTDKPVEKTDCPPQYAAVKSCFVEVKDSVLGYANRDLECRKKGGVMARPNKESANDGDSQCVTKAYLAKLKENNEYVESAVAPRAMAELCTVPDFQCGDPKKLSAEDKQKFARELDNKCVFAGNVSKYKITSVKTERKTIRRGMCEGPRTVKFGEVTVECESKAKDQVLCNPVIFDTKSPLPDNFEKGTVAGRCVPKRANSTELCQNSFDEDNKGKQIDPAKRFWNSKIPGIREKFNETAEVMNKTCSSSVARGSQCKECKIMQAGLKNTKLITKTCPTTASNSGTGQPPKAPNTSERTAR